MTDRYLAFCVDEMVAAEVWKAAEEAEARRADEDEKVALLDKARRKRGMT